MGYVEQLLSKGETIVVRSRQHWVAWLASALTNGFIIAVSLALGIFLDGFVKGLTSLSSDVVDLLLNAVRIAALLVGLFAAVRFGWDVLQWWAEEYIVTTRRVIQSEGIINKRTADSSLEKVNDVVLTQSVFGRLLGYGNLEIVTGSDVGVNNLTRLRDAITFKTAMLDQKAKLGGEYGERMPDEAAGRDVPRLIAELDDLRKKGLLSDAEFNEKKAKLLSQL